MIHLDSLNNILVSPDLTEHLCNLAILFNNSDDNDDDDDDDNDDDDDY